MISSRAAASSWELEKQMTEAGIKPKWIGVPGVSMKKAFPEMFDETLEQLRDL